MNCTSRNQTWNPWSARFGAGREKASTDVPRRFPSFHLSLEFLGILCLSPAQLGPFIPEWILSNLFLYHFPLSLCSLLPLGLSCSFRVRVCEDIRNYC